MTVKERHETESMEEDKDMKNKLFEREVDVSFANISHENVSLH